MYHYTECGLDNVQLLGGYELVETPYGETVEITNIDALHRLIGQELCEQQHLSGKEIRFLRREMGLSQKALGHLLDKTDQTVANWEKGEVPCPALAETIIKKMYLEHIDDNSSTVTEMLITLADLDNERDSLERQLHQLQLIQRNEHWEVASA